MAGAQVGITIDDERVRRALGKLTLITLDLKEPFEEIGAALLTSTQQRFEDEESPEGERWQGLSPATMMRPRGAGGRDAKGRYTGRKGERRGGEHILRDRGFLYQSLTYLAGRFDLALGSNKVQAALHQLGGTDDMAPGPAAVPARPYLGTSAADDAEILAIFSDHLGGAFA